MWALEQQVVALQLWARDVLQAPGQHQAGGLQEVSPDGRHLKGSARGGVGDKAIALVLAYLSRWGLLRPGPGFPGRGPYRPGRLAKGGHHFLHRKDNQAELKDWAALQYPPDDRYCYHQVPSGALWVWRVRTTAQIPPEPALAFPGLQQMVEMHRHQTHQRSGEVREETHLAQPCPGGCCQPGGHRAGSPGSTTKEIPSWVRACRTRKAAQSLAALRNLLLGFLHQLTTPVLRSVRSFSTNPMPLYRWLSGCI